MLRKMTLLMVIVLVVSVFSSCAAASTVTVTTTQPPITTTVTKTVLPTPTVTTTPPVTSVPTRTAGDLAFMGEARYDGNCTFTYCHAGYTGRQENINPPVITYFDNAQELFNFIKSFMHHPDTVSYLTDDQYVEITAYVLIQNGVLKAGDLFGQGNMATYAIP